MRQSIKVVIIAIIFLSHFACSVNKKTKASTYRYISREAQSAYSFYTHSGYREIFALGDAMGKTYLVHVKSRANNPKIIRTIKQVKIGWNYTLALSESKKPIKIKPDMELFGRIDEEWYINPTDNLNWLGLRVVNGKMYGAYTSPDLVNIEGVLYIRNECTKHE